VEGIEGYVSFRIKCKNKKAVQYQKRLNVLLDFGLSLQKACDGCGVGVSQRTPHRCRLTSAYLCEIACVDGRLGG